MLKNTRMLAFICLCVAMILVQPMRSVAGSLHLFTQQTERSTDVRVDLKLSVHFGGANVNQYSLGRYYLPKSGKPVLEEINILGLVILVMQMSVVDTQENVKYFLSATAGLQKRTLSVTRGY